MFFDDDMDIKYGSTKKKCYSVFMRIDYLWGLLKPLNYSFFLLHYLRSSGVTSPGLNFAGTGLWVPTSPNQNMVRAYYLQIYLTSSDLNCMNWLMDDLWLQLSMWSGRALEFQVSYSDLHV